MKVECPDQMLFILIALLLCIAIQVSSINTPSEAAALQILTLVNSNLESLSKNEVKDRPFVTIGYAQTIDGSISPLERSRLDISSNCSFRLLHSLRAYHDVVLVGINTLEFDQPRLNVRDPLPGISVSYEQQPRAVVIDSNLRIIDLIERGKYR